MPLNGQLIIGYDRVATASSFRATDPARASQLDPPFFTAGAAEVARACALAAAASIPTAGGACHAGAVS